jgi:RNA polymerase sigma factor (sigma-70 family)
MPNAPKPAPVIPAESTATRDDRPDTDLVAACLDGDQGAWRVLVLRYGDLVFAVARRNGLDRALADDVVQEVFGILLRQMPSLRNPTGLAKWLMTTGQRVSLRMLRRARREVDTVVEAPKPGDLAPDEMMRLERQHLVREALRRLGGRCETLLTALYLRDEATSYEHVARALDLPVGSIGPTRARCLEKLMRILETMDAGDLLSG